MVTVISTPDAPPNADSTKNATSIAASQLSSVGFSRRGVRSSTRVPAPGAVRVRTRLERLGGGVPTSSSDRGTSERCHDHHRYTSRCLHRVNCRAMERHAQHNSCAFVDGVRGPDHTQGLPGGGAGEFSSWCRAVRRAGRRLGRPLRSLAAPSQRADEPNHLTPRRTAKPLDHHDAQNAGDTSRTGRTSTRRLSAIRTCRSRRPSAARRARPDRRPRSRSEQPGPPCVT